MSCAPRPGVKPPVEAAAVPPLEATPVPARLAPSPVEARPAPAPSPKPPPFAASEIRVNADKITGNIKNAADLNWYFDPDYELQPNYVRMWCLTGRVRSRKAIFPDLTADPDDPSAYRWAALDEKLLEYAERGIKPYILLSISPAEINRIKRGNKTPRWLIDNRRKIARSLARIVYHITSRDSSWSGMGTRVDYVELWNEPGAMIYWVNPYKYWPKRKYSRSCYSCLVDIFEMTIADIRELCGREVRIGAWAGSQLADGGLDIRILGEMSKRRVPLDFYSWHDYRVPPALFDFGLLDRHITGTRARLRARGYGIPQHITEWNNVCWCADEEGNCEPCSGKNVNHWYRTIKSAAYTAEYLMHAQDMPVEVTHRWDGGKDFYGLWDKRGAYRYPVFYTYKLFRSLLSSRRINAESDDYFVLAGKKDDKINILIACDEYNNSSEGYNLTVDGIRSSFGYTVTAVTEEEYRGGTEIIQSGQGESILDIAVPTDDYAVHLIEIIRE
ncbi:MAG: hypothetical protein P9M00_12085 [Candidatus Tritonobacter lacicola]|nr:hypothetical protein [Candidatus Tritonobacter lacicola]